MTVEFLIIAVSLILVFSYAFHSFTVKHNQRLSQALCRLRLSEEVSQEDVDEAIRLTHSSKASLLEDSATNRGSSNMAGGGGSYNEDSTSSIYVIMRDHAIQARTGNISYMQVYHIRT